jgi:hypothetical protein
LVKGIDPYLNHSNLAIGARPKRPEQFTLRPLIFDLIFILDKVFFKAFLKLGFGFSNSFTKNLPNNEALDPRLLTGITDK